MTTKSWIFYIIASILSVVMLASAILMCIPSTQQAIADKIATNLSPAYAEMKDDNENKDSQISDLTSEIDTLNKTITDKDASITAKNKQIAEKDSLISSQTEQLNTCNSNIQTLNTQKAVLLTAVTEIDNKINSTTDSVELDDLETRKTAILAQIDTLNTQIATLTQEKTQLTQKIATLTQEKADLQAEVTQLESDKAKLEKQVEALENNTGVSCVGTYYSFGSFGTVPEEKLNSWFYSELPKNDAISALSAGSVYCDETKSLIVTYDGQAARTSISKCYSNTKWADVQLSLDGVSKTLDDMGMYCNAMTSDVIGFELYLSVDEGSVVSMKINFKTTRLLTGVYYAADGTFVDFDNLANSTNSNFVNWSYVCLKNYESDGHCLWFYNTAISYCGVAPVDLGDDYFIYKNGGVKYTKTAPTPTAEQVYVNISVQIDAEQYFTLNFDKGAGTFKITNSSDSSIAQECSIEFVSFDVVNKILTFKDASTDSQFVFTDLIFSLSEDGNTYFITGANYNNNLTN